MQKLTREHQKLIEDNYQEFIRQLKKRVFKNKNIGYLGDVETIVDESISYLPKLALEYDPKRGGKYGFINFAVQRCIFRLIDQYRSANRHGMKYRIKNKIVKKIKTELLNTLGYCHDEDVITALKSKGYDPKKFNIKKMQRMDNNLQNMEKYKYTESDKGLDRIDWMDFNQGMIKEIDTFFQDATLPERTNVSPQDIYKLLIKDYILPRCNGEDGKTLGQISHRVGLSKGRLSQIVHGPKMQSFIHFMYDGV